MEKEKFRERQRFERLVQKIDRDVDAAVVEGHDDRRVLEKLGMSSRIFESAERSVEDLVGGRRPRSR